MEVQPADSGGAEALMYLFGVMMLVVISLIVIL